MLGVGCVMLETGCWVCDVSDWVLGCDVRDWVLGL